MKAILAALVACMLGVISAQPTLTPPRRRLIQHPPSRAGLDGEQQARAWLRRHDQVAQRLAAKRVLVRQQSSLLDEHFAFALTINDVPVHDADIVISVAKQSGALVRVVTRDLTGTPATVAAKHQLNSDDAQEIAWQHLAVGGELRALPTAQQCYVHVDGALRPAWLVELAPTEPAGDWRVFVDAVDGHVLDVIHAVSHARQKVASPRTGPVSDRLAAIHRFEMRRAAVQKIEDSRVDGRAVVFDSNPVTDLGRSDLTDDTPDSDIADAYVERPLRDISIRDGVYLLDGPWVQIRDFEAPDTAPTTTDDGFWDARRGEQMFNDAMSYYHIDENQRYIQSLGYGEANGIQYGPITVDADGRNGNDDSVYNSVTNSISFGHGCVDDNEDADVVIHEYGHAVQHAIEPGLGQGGDATMLAEGFGDYWAGSWRMRTNAGLIHQPAWVFPWDGHNECWDGRRMDDFAQQYQPGAFYDRHVHGQIWSTGAFQALLTLMRQGVPRAQVDRIILESMFGMGRGVRAPEWCAAIVTTAARLYPAGPHAQVFQNAFARQNLLEKVASYRTISAHIPPDNASWQSEIQLANPNDGVVNATVTTYEADGEGFFQAIDTQAVSAAAGVPLVLVPAGSGQRWLSIESDQPLVGQTRLTRRISAASGRETATLPLIGATETATSLVFPHVPADRDQFWSGWVLLNPNAEAVDLKIELVGEHGTDLSELRRENIPVQLAPNQKWVAFLAEGPAGEPGLFDDRDSEEKVAWIRVTGAQPLAGFQLYGYRADRGAAATAGILATPDQARALQPIRVSLVDVDWNGFALVNPSEEAAAMTVTVYGDDGAIVAEGQTTLPARGKTLGLNQRGVGLRFPVDAPVVEAGDAAAHTVVISAAAPLRVFGLTGDENNQVLDGAAALGLTTRTFYPLPSGTLEVFQAKIPGTVAITRFHEDGTNDQELIDMAAGTRRTVVLPTGLVGVRLEGAFFTSALISLDDEGSLSVVEGKQTAYNP